LCDVIRCSFQEVVAITVNPEIKFSNAFIILHSSETISIYENRLFSRGPPVA
jgi:hypothetical protein